MAEMLTSFAQESTQSGRLSAQQAVAGRLGRDWCAVTEKFALLNNLDDLWRNHLLPSTVPRLQFGQGVRRINSQVFGVIVGNLFDVLIIDQILKQGAQVRRDLD